MTRNTPALRVLLTASAFDALKDRPTPPKSIFGEREEGQTPPLGSLLGCRGGDVALCEAV